IAFFRIVPSTFDIPILVFALLYIALEAVMVLLTGFAVSSALLHLSGAVLGFLLATVMIKKGLVDCEDWDLYVVMQGRPGRARSDLPARRAPRPDATPAPRKKAGRAGAGGGTPRSIEEKAAAAGRRLRTHLDAGEAEAAHSVYEKAARTMPG